MKGITWIGACKPDVLSTAEYMMLGQYMLVLISSTALKLCWKLSKFKYLEMNVKNESNSVK